MADYLDTLHDGLVDASRRLSAQRRRRWRRRGGAATALVLVVGAPALAATGVWRPPIGDGREPAPKITAQAPPADQLALLGVLRRPQTAADRGATTLDALRLIGGRSVTGVRTNSIRLLSDSPRNGGLVLVPVARYARPRMPVPADTPPEWRERLNPPPVDDALCVFQLKGAGAGVACWSTADVREGRAWMSLGHRAVWVVPDGVATMRTTYPDAPAVEATVHGNVARFTEPKGRHGSPTTTFLDAQGAAVRVLDPVKPPAHSGFPAEYDPVPRGSSHSGGVRRIAISGSGLDARYELHIVPPKRRPPAFIVLDLQRPRCAGDRHVSVLVGAISGSQGFGADLGPSTGDFHRARWCPGTYRGSYRFKGEREPFGTFSFRVAG